MLSRKYYKAIAEAIKDSTWSYRLKVGPEDRIVVDREDLLTHLCTLLQADNINFNPTKFKEACR